MSSTKRILVALSLCSVFAAAHAQDRIDTREQAGGYAQYRHVVLGYAGDASAEGAATQPTGHERREGPYERYLINNGFATVNALAAAQRIGEQPRWAAEASGALQRPLTSYEIYRKVVLGQTIQPPATAN